MTEIVHHISCATGKVWARYMKLSRLEIFGFKSFAKKLDVKMLGGITCFVGPNGCGKTNVVDAIRWAMGEQRPTQIRLDRMEDVIFKGSGTRHPLGMAEVTLTIDNDQGILPVSMPEVAITRRLFRSGESEYLINRKPCRLGDINDMFMDTGAGTNSYSFFEQSMINSILSDKAEDRRHVFEEAAGVTKYRVRRRSAMNTLASIEDDLDRLSDIMTELERRVNSLKRQAAKAAQYRELKGELRARTMSLASFEIEKARKILNNAGSALLTVQSEMETLKAKAGVYTADVERHTGDIGKVETELVETAGRYESVVRAMADRESEAARCEARMESLVEMTARAREEAKRSSLSLEKLAESHGTCSETLARAEENLKKLSADYTARKENIRVFESKASGESADRDALESEYRRVERELSSCGSESAALETRQKDGEKRYREISAVLDETCVAVIRINKDNARLQERRLQAAKEKNDVERKLDSVRTRRSSLLDKLRGLEDNLLGARERKAALRAETEFLERIVRSFEGCSGGVKNAVQSPCLEGKVLGVLSDLISAEERYIPALETAFGLVLESVVVETGGEALAGARYLAEEARGRAVFVALDGKEPGVRDEPWRDQPGVAGPLNEFVRTDVRFMPAVGRLLEGFVLVETLDRAYDLHRVYPDICFVSMDGGMVSVNGAVHGGKAGEDSERVALSRCGKLSEIRKMLAAADRDIAELEIRRTELSGEGSALSRDMSDIELRRESLVNTLNGIATEEARVIAQKEAAVSLITKLQSEMGELKKSSEAFELRLREIGENVGTLRKTAADIESRRAQSASRIRETGAVRERLRSEINELEIERAALTEKRAALIRELDTIAERREALAGSSRRTLKEIEDAEDEIMEVGEKKKSAREALDEFAREQDRLRMARAEAEKHLADLKTLKMQKERELQDNRNELVSYTQKETSLTFEKEEASLVIENIIARLTEDFFIENTEEIPPYRDESGFDVEDEKQHLNEVRKKLHGISDVNLAAEADYREEKERLDFLTGERDDLVRARDTLREIIAKLNQVARTRFLGTFEQINQNFQKTFHDFFEGGVAALALEEEADPLEASILISARPPGKNVRTINLLSTGERALTAISLLFAIYMVKPSPFCILDEVDAPLDDANIDRFLGVIKEFTRKTQFIIVTHNKKTMAQADNLYGITMEEPGLSSLVSVRLSEVDSYRSENAAGAGKSERPDGETVNV